MRDAVNVQYDLVAKKRNTFMARKRERTRRERPDLPLEKNELCYTREAVFTHKEKYF
jgi:hypothetical protein